MKSKGFLDDIEKLVDEVWDSEEKQINTHVDREKKAMEFWYDKEVSHQIKRRHDEYRREYLSEVERRMWDSPYPRGHGRTPSPSTLRHRCTECGVEIKVVYIEDKIDFNEWRAYDSGRFPPIRRKHDHFHCPRCRQQINVIGKVIELTVNMME